MQIEIFEDEDTISSHSLSYAEIQSAPGAFVGRAEITIGDATFTVEDSWTLGESALTLSRLLRVSGNAPGGFLSSFRFTAGEPLTWLDVAPFVPGMLYGPSEHLTGVAIGGKANYLAGVREIRIREDRMPAPLFGLHFGDGTSIATLVTRPDARTTGADAVDTAAETLIDEQIRVGALGGVESDNRISTGYWFPGTEGEATYSGDTFPGGQMRTWRRRYHPIRDGLVQEYQVAFRLGRDERFQDFRTTAWRWAWSTLNPEILPQDIDAARRWSTAVLAQTVVTTNGRSGIPNVLEVTTGEPPDPQRYRALMGFTGRSVESAYFLLRGATREAGETANQYRELGLAILESFVELPMSPPEYEGFTLADGQPVIGRDDLVHLRSVTEGGKYMLRSFLRERAEGHDHPRWLRWCVDLGGWLLVEQRPNGAWPRALTEDGEPIAAETGYESIPYLVELSQATGESRYLDAALRAGQFSWANGHNLGIFIGGTIDNPNVIDKEAGTLALEAYLALFEETRDNVWLGRAAEAADFAETWIYCWNVPMPDDADAPSRGWKPGVSTVGLQLIASGHSLVDTYMAWDVASYAKLYRYTGNEHYLEVARLLLHNTKLMLALPGRTYDLVGPGWQQEHWSLAPRRGSGVHRRWLPWVSCSHLEGIYAMEDWDPGLFAQIAGAAE